MMDRIDALEVAALVARAEAAERDRDAIDQHNRELWAERQATESAAGEVAQALISAQAEAASMRTERDALRAALIHIADLQLRRREDALHVRAYRATANDLSAPFSDERVTDRLARWRPDEQRDAMPLDPAHRGALIQLLERVEQQLEDVAAREQIAALRFSLEDPNAR